MREEKILKDGLLCLVCLQKIWYMFILREREIGSGERGKENTQIHLWCDYMISLQVRNNLFTLQSRLDVYFAQSSAGTSVQTMLHWAQVCTPTSWYNTHISLQDPRGARLESSLCGLCHCWVDASGIRSTHVDVLYSHLFSRSSVYSQIFWLNSDLQITPNCLV